MRIFLDCVGSRGESGTRNVLEVTIKSLGPASRKSDAGPFLENLIGKSVLKPRINPAFRLLYDLRWMELGQAGGVEQVTYELIAAISQLDRKNSYRVFAPRSACWEWDFPSRFKVSRHYSDPGEPLAERLHSFVAQCQAERMTISSGACLAAREEFSDLAFDIVLSTCSYIHPEMIEFPGILTIHDLQHLHYPEFFAKDEWENRERLYRDSAARAKHIICGSEFTRRDVNERYGIPLEKMTTIWNIPSSAMWRIIPTTKRRALLAGMGLSGPYLFYPAQCWPHKNHHRLIEAFGRIASELPGNLKLVLTGRPFPPEHPALALMHERGLGSRIQHLGFRSPLEIRALFQECMALVFPSLFEGFGMPVAEAIIAGKPVACSNVTSLPEIAGDAAITFDPRDVDEMAARIFDLATQPELRASLAAAARRRQHVFSAQLSAIKTLGVYEDVFEKMSRAQP
jgi:glycosyltransferase involved in cell wall biosynthesis